MIQTLFTILIAIQFLAVALHDLLDIPGWTHGRQVRAALGPAKTILGTAINCIFPGIAVAFAIEYWQAPKPPHVLNYWLIYCAVTVLGAITAWWIPYFRGADEKTKALYGKMYAGTYQILPPRADNPRPNLLHLFFHAVFLATLILAIIMRINLA
jgi:hypothetical protein